MVLVKTAKCTIIALNNEGLGIGDTDAGLITLPYVLPGDIAEFECHSYRGKSNYILKNIWEVNSARAAAPCQYFGTCGGCLLQHLTEQDYSAFKLRLLTDSLLAHDITTTLAPMITIEKSQRRRANLEAVKKNGQLYLGFHRFHSHQIINIDECHALLPELSRLIRPLKLILYEVMEERQKLQMFIIKASNGIDISLEIQNCSSLEQDKKEKLKKFAEENELIRLIFRYRKIIDVIYTTEIPYILFDNIPVEVDAYCFLQSSFQSDNILTGLVMNYLTTCQPGDKILDLFCGRGTYTIPLSKNFSVDGYESDTKALAALGRSSANSRRNITLYKRDLFRDPVNIQALRQYTACVINPPRAGAEAQIHEISKSNIPKICHISCNPSTFSRDSKILIRGGYQLVGVTPVDQSYWSPHLEIVGYFQR